MIILKKTKLKVKKRVWVFLILLIFISIGIYSAKKIHQNNLYKATNEYKLLEIGYTLEEIKILEQNLEQKKIETLFNNPKNDFLLNLFKEKYYIKINLDRYIAYEKENNNKTTSEIVTMVNTYNDYKFYDYNIKTDTTKDYLLLVNKFYNLDELYEPDDLVKISNKYYYGSNHQIRSTVYQAFIDMWNEAYKENIYLIVNSSYRDYKTQREVYDDYKNSQGTTYADAIAARPGHSEHQTGLSLDIFSKTHTTTSNFKNSPAHIWLTENAYRFGFIQRYKENKEHITGFAEESWHWRYVGVEAATYMQNNDITFDEYYAYFLEK